MATSAGLASTLLVSAIPRVAASRSQLSEQFRTASSDKGLTTAVVFRSVIDGEEHEMAELVDELGGVQSDFPIALEILSGIEQASRNELRRLAHTPTPTIAAAAFLSSRRRAESTVPHAIDFAACTEPARHGALRIGLAMPPVS